MVAELKTRRRLKRSDLIGKMLGVQVKGTYFLGQYLTDLTTEEHKREILTTVQRELCTIGKLYGAPMVDYFRLVLPDVAAPYPRLRIEFVYPHDCVLCKVDLAFVKDPSDKRDDIAVLEENYCTQEGRGELMLSSIRISPRFKDAYSQLTDFNKRRMDESIHWYIDLCKEGTPPRFRIVDMPEYLSFEVEAYNYWHRTNASRV